MSSNNLKSTNQIGGSSTSRFQNKNLNNNVSSTVSNRIAGNSRSVVLSSAKKIGKPVGLAAYAPPPLNTPSLRRENNGKDVTIPLVPAGNSGGVWGMSANDNKSTNVSNAVDVSNVPASVTAKPAPWAKTTPEPLESSIDFKPKAAATAHKSWADAESDEEDDDEDDEPVTPIPPAPIPSRTFPTSTQSTNSSLNQNRIYQRDTVVQSQPPAQSINSGSFSHRNAPYASNHNDYNERSNQNSHVENARLELQQLEQRKIRQQEQHYKEQVSHSSYQQSSNTNQRGAPQHQYSGSGLLNDHSGHNQREEAMWERAKKKPIDVSQPSNSADTQHQPRVIRNSTHGVVGPPHRSGAPGHYSNQYPQMNRIRGLSEDLSLTESGAPSHPQHDIKTAPAHYKLNSEVRHKEEFDMNSLETRPNGTANAAAATIVESNKSFASLLKHSDDAADHVSNRNSSNVAPVVSPSSKRKVLFDPKNGQYVESQEEKWARAPRRIPEAVSDKPSNVAKDSKFAPTLLTRAHSGNDSVKGKVGPVSPKADSYANSMEPTDAESIAKLEQDKIERQKERHTRGPRTKGLLFRHTENGEIERVLCAEEEIEQEAARKKVKEERKTHSESRTAFVATTNDNEDLEDEDKRKSKSLKVKKERKPLSKKNANYDVFPSDVSNGSALNTDEIQKIASGTDAMSLSFISGLGVQEADRRESKLASWSSPSRSDATSRMHWAQSGGIQMLQPQQNPNAELDHSLTLNMEFDGILGSSLLSGTTTTQSWNYNNLDDRAITTNYFESDFTGSNFPAFDGLTGNSIVTSDANGEQKPPVERIKRGSKFDKGSVAHKERSDRADRPERPVRQYKSPRPPREEKDVLQSVDDSGVPSTRPIRKPRPDKGEKAERPERVVGSVRPPRVAPKRERLIKPETITSDK